MRALKQLKKRYENNLNNKHAILQLKKKELKNAKEVLKISIIDRERVSMKNQSTKKRIHQLDCQIKDINNTIVKLESSITSYIKKGVFSLDYNSRKRELKSKINDAEVKIGQEEAKLGRYKSERSDLERELKDILLESIDIYISEQKNQVFLLEKEVKEILCDIDKLVNDLSAVETEIQKLNKVSSTLQNHDKHNEQNEFKTNSIPLIDNILTKNLANKNVRHGDLIPYSEKYGVNPNYFINVSITSIDFSRRLSNRLLRNGFTTVGELLKTNDSVVSKISGFGKNCYNELHGYLSNLTEIPNVIPDEVNKKIEMTEELVPFKENIIYGDFGFLDDIEISLESKQMIEKIRDAHSDLGFDLIEKCIEGSQEILEITTMLQEFVNQFENRIKIEPIVNSIPKDRLEAKISLVIKCFTNNHIALEHLQGLIRDENQSLEDYLYVNSDNIICNDQWLIKLIKWCQYNLDMSLKHFFDEKLKDPRQLMVIKQRAKRMTLEEIAKPMNITRERVRQIEAKFKRQFSNWQKHQRILFKIFLDLNEEIGLFTQEISNFIGEYGEEFVYLMKYSENNENYDSNLDMFLMNGSIFTEKVQTFVESLPDAFPEKKIIEFIQIAEENNKYPGKMVLAAIKDSYRKTGDTYHRVRLSLTMIYGNVLKEFYPEGLHVYDTDELRVFKQRVMDLYSINISDKSDRAIIGILTKIGILCGRGIYKYRDEKPYISSDLAGRIHDYIENSESPIFMTNTIFSVFDEELLAEGIDNKYFLQGVLRDLYEHKWVFRRDYISKDESYTNFYSSIVEYIENSQYPISKEEIKREFPGVTEIVINVSINDPYIINLFGLYIHSCRLKLSNADKKYLNNIIDRYLNRKEVYHCAELYDYIKDDHPTLLSNNFIQHAYSLYSLLEYLFKDYYNFSRPYVSKKNAKIERPVDVLKDIIIESERIGISEIQAFTREHRVQINTREFINSFNDTHLLINDLEIATIEYIGVTEKISDIIESRILAEIDSTTPIHQLECIHSLPGINVEWDVWLIYSILNKWSTKLEVGASAPQFNQSYPIVAPIGRLDTTMIEESKGKYESRIVLADDLSEIDELISDFILNDLEVFDEL